MSAPKIMLFVRNWIACCVLWIFPLLAVATTPVAGDQSARATFFVYDLMASAASLSLGATTASCNSQRGSVCRAWWIGTPGLSSSVSLASLDGLPVAARGVSRIDGPAFDGLEDHARRHSNLHPNAYYNAAVRHIENATRFNFRHDGQFKDAFISRTGVDSFTCGVPGFSWTGVASEQTAEGEDHVHAEGPK